MTKEEVLKKIVSTEFNRFLDYYRDAPDLNKTSDKRERERKNDRNNSNDDDRGERRGRREKREHKTAANMTRYFINQGKKDGFSPKLLMGMINSHMGGLSPEIGQIEIMKMFSFFEMETGHTSDLQRAAKQMEFNGREVAIEESSPRPEGNGEQKDNRNRGRGRGSEPRGDRGRGRRKESSAGSHGSKRRRRY